MSALFIISPVPSQVYGTWVFHEYFAANIGHLEGNLVPHSSWPEVSSGRHRQEKWRLLPSDGWRMWLSEEKR